MSWFRRAPRTASSGIVERIGIDVTHEVRGRDTMWLVKLEDSDEILRMRDRAAPEGHLSLSRPGDAVEIVRRGRRILTLSNADVASALARSMDSRRAGRYHSEISEGK